MIVLFACFSPGQNRCLAPAGTQPAYAFAIDAFEASRNHRKALREQNDCHPHHDHHHHHHPSTSYGERDERIEVRYCSEGTSSPAVRWIENVQCWFCSFNRNPRQLLLPTFCREIRRKPINRRKNSCTGCTTCCRRRCLSCSCNRSTTPSTARTLSLKTTSEAPGQST